MATYSRDSMKNKLELQELVPYLNLPSNRDVNVDIWDFKQRKNLVIIFHHGRLCGHCRNKLKELSEVYGRFNFLKPRF